MLGNTFAGTYHCQGLNKEFSCAWEHTILGALSLRVKQVVP